MSAPTCLARLVTHAELAQKIVDAFSDLFEPEEMAASASELPIGATNAPRAGLLREGAMGSLLPDKDAPWQCELYFAEPPEEAAIRAILAEIAGPEVAAAFVFEQIEARDWISASLEGLAAVDAGRFTIHGAHARQGLKQNRYNIEIEAALAFGTGHHGTTRGCLLHLESVLKRRHPQQIVDIGSGTGVLAFAAAKALRQKIWAGELDPISVGVARENARLNRVGAFVRPLVAAGLQHPDLRKPFYDLVMANILARPLKGLAREIARATKNGSELILSGLLPQDVPGILAKYRAFGFYLVKKHQIEGWCSLILRRGATHKT